ncbi:MAG: hypothetical protein OEW72_00750 [Gammaproteobacteria bacterium]|nr:hypothetical protein [Gammaproteobacteria bacterium]
MISPDVASAVRVLGRDGVLTPGQATLLGRVARGELVSLYPVLQTLLYGAVLAITGGVALLLKDRVADFGPLTIALLLSLAVLACLGWVARAAPAFSRGLVESPHIAFDYILLLGALLLAADLAWCEWRFTPLGANWAWHLCLVSVIYSALALRFDSRVLFVLGLTTFAAWRGVAVLSVEQALFAWAGAGPAVRLNGIACGLLFIAAGQALVRRDFKAHFEPAATLLGWGILLLAVAGGTATGPDASLWLHRGGLLGLGLLLALRSAAPARFGLFVMGVLAAYAGFLACTLPWVSSGAPSALYIALSAVGLLVLLLRVRARRARATP